MKRSRRFFALLFVTALLLSGCSSSEQGQPFEQLLSKAGNAAEKAAAKQAEQLTELAGAQIIDFDALQKVNPEIYAWLYIPGTAINAPIAQSESSDSSYYQSHGPDRSENAKGCLYTHYRYSGKRFEEPVSVIYGKTQTAGGAFAGLEKLYHSAESLQQHQEVLLFTADAVLRYRVYCATEFSDVLISREYREFQTEEKVSAFLEDLRNYRTLQRQTDDSVRVASDDRLLVLSTILSRDADKRFLVVAKLVENAN